MRTRLALGLALALALVGCAPDRVDAPRAVGEPPATNRATQRPSSAATEPGSSYPCSPNASALELRTLVGQLYIAGVEPKPLDQATTSKIRDARLGGVVLIGNSDAGATAIAELSASIGLLSPDDLPILVAADQEGGQVQRLKGSGFSEMPSAREQGKLAPDELRQRASVWGQELAGAGVLADLAPVADVVGTDWVERNAPIGALERDFGSDSAQVSAAVSAFAQGMRDSGVASVAKHFPGLGMVSDNTDAGPARDSTTVANDPGWASFRAAIDAGVDAVMVSSAIYEKIDPTNQAVFSSKIITESLRGELGFDRVVMSDDIGVAASVRDVPIAERGTRFLKAGGDLVLTADLAHVSDMIADTVAAAHADPAFAKQLVDSGARVLAMKESVGLVSCAGQADDPGAPVG